MSKARLVITAITLEKRPVGQVVVEYGVSRSWVHGLLARYRAEGQAAFEARSPALHTSPGATPSETVHLGVRVRAGAPRPRSAPAACWTRSCAPGPGGRHGGTASDRSRPAPRPAPRPRPRHRDDPAPRRPTRRARPAWRYGRCGSPWSGPRPSSRPPPAGSPAGSAPARTSRTSRSAPSRRRGRARPAWTADRTGTGHGLPPEGRSTYPQMRPLPARHRARRQQPRIRKAAGKLQDHIDGCLHGFRGVAERRSAARARARRTSQRVRARQTSDAGTPARSAAIRR